MLWAAVTTGNEFALSWIDLTIIVAFLGIVVTVGLLQSRSDRRDQPEGTSGPDSKADTDGTKKGSASEDYFLAGRGLSWWLIGISLVAANISAEQFVGMNGQAAQDGIGLAIATYEWFACVTLVVVAFVLLPKFLRLGISTIPEFLEFRFTRSARTIMSLLMVIVLAAVNIATVIYLGAKLLEPLLDFEGVGIAELSWGVGILAAIYVFAGGLKACAWADLIQGTSLILGGAVILVLAIMAIDDPSRFENTSPEIVNASLGTDEDATVLEKMGILKERKMHMVLPSDNSALPWTVLLFGLWIPNFYYWGLNQYIIQRTLGAKALSEGQKGIVFAALLKLVLPFIVCIPGIIAFTLYGPLLHDNAMSNEGQQATLARFAEQRHRQSDQQILYPFNADFADRVPDQAEAIIAYHADLAGEDATSKAEDLAGKNEMLIQSILAKNPDGYLAERELTGYDYDSAFPQLIRNLAPVGLRGFVLAAIMGAVISSLASMMNAASTIFTLDIYRTLFRSDASQKELVWVGRSVIPVCMVVGCLIAPILGSPEFEGGFTFIQEFQGFISTSVLTIFIFGIFVPRAPRIVGLVGLCLGPVIYGALYFLINDIPFPNRMGITVLALSIVCGALTIAKPLPQKLEIPDRSQVAMDSSNVAKVLGGISILATIALYLIFW